MQMPLTAVVLIVEFTHADHNLLYPLLLAVAGSVMTIRAMPAVLACMRHLRVRAEIPEKQVEHSNV